MNTTAINPTRSGWTIAYRYNGKTIYYPVAFADSYDHKTIAPKPGTILFRLVSEHETGGFPAVCINIDRSLVYFLADYSGDDLIWESKGIKFSWIPAHGDTLEKLIARAEYAATLPDRYLINLDKYTVI